MNTHEGMAWPDSIPDLAAVYDGMGYSYEVATATADELQTQLRLTDPRFPTRRTTVLNDSTVQMYKEAIFADGTDWFAEAYGGRWSTFGGRAVAHARAIRGPYGVEVVEAFLSPGVDPRPADWIHSRDPRYTGAAGYIMRRHGVSYPLRGLQ